MSDSDEHLPTYEEYMAAKRKPSANPFTSSPRKVAKSSKAPLSKKKKATTPLTANTTPMSQHGPARLLRSGPSGAVPSLSATVKTPLNKTTTANQRLPSSRRPRAPRPAARNVDPNAGLESESEESNGEDEIPAVKPMTEAPRDAKTSIESKKNERKRAPDGTRSERDDSSLGGHSSTVVNPSAMIQRFQGQNRGVQEELGHTASNGVASGSKSRVEEPAKQPDRFEHASEGGKCTNMTESDAPSDTALPESLEEGDIARDQEMDNVGEPPVAASARAEQAQLPVIITTSPEDDQIESRLQDVDSNTAASIMLRNILKLAIQPIEWLGKVDIDDYRFNTPADEQLAANFLHDDEHSMLSYLFIRAIDTAIDVDQDEKHSYSYINVHFTGQLNKRQLVQDEAIIRDRAIPATAVWKSVFEVLLKPRHVSTMSELTTQGAIARRSFTEGIITAAPHILRPNSFALLLILATSPREYLEKVMAEHGFSVKEGEPWYEDCIAELLKNLRREPMYQGYTHFRIAHEFQDLSNLLHELHRKLYDESSKHGAKVSAKRKMSEMSGGQEVEVGESSGSKRIKGKHADAMGNRREEALRKAKGNKHG